MQTALYFNQKRMSELFGVEVNTINYNLKDIFKRVKYSSFQLFEKFE